MHKAIVIRGYQSLLTKIMSQPVLLTFKFENFAHLPNKVDQPIKARVQSDCNGNRWSLELYPAGDQRAKESGRIALFLCSKNAVPNLDVKIEFLIKDKTGVSVDHSEFASSQRIIVVLGILHLLSGRIFLTKQRVYSRMKHC
jgi:hypothetical protein